MKESYFKSRNINIKSKTSKKLIFKRHNEVIKDQLSTFTAKLCPISRHISPLLYDTKDFVYQSEIAFKVSNVRTVRKKASLSESGAINRFLIPNTFLIIFHFHRFVGNYFKNIEKCHK